MTLRRIARPALYHTRILLENQHASLSCQCSPGRITQAYPILSRCTLRLDETSARAASAYSWRYVLSVPVLLLGEEGTARSQLTLYPELTTPLTEEDMRTVTDLYLDLSFPIFQVAPDTNDVCDVYYTAAISLSIAV